MYVHHKHTHGTVMRSRLSMFYILNGKLAVPVKDGLAWSRWFEAASNDGSRHVKQEHVGGCLISTVFLGINHNFTDDGDPLLFETMIFRGGDGQDTWRCSSWQEAEAQHKAAVEQVRREIKEKVND